MAKEAERKKRGIWPVLAIFVVGAVCCWMGLVKVDRQIRAVTINQSPPLWEAREDGDTVFLTLMGQSAAFDLGPVKRVGQAIGEEALRIVNTPAAPERVWRMVREGLFLTADSDR